MELRSSSVIILVCFLGLASGFHFRASKQDRHPPPASFLNDPLILTPYIYNGQIATAKKLAAVDPALGGGYSGFFTVNEECNSNMFFWFIPSANMEKNPVAVWLQGGPGASSLYGLFNENGPLSLTVNGNLKPRKFAWTLAASYIFIDNPVGTGFSFAKSTDCYSKNQTHVGENLLIVLKQFYAMFPELSQNPLFISGESYAGKYVPALGYAIHRDNQDSATPINLNGIAIGNGLVDPQNQLHYSDYLYQLGIIDSNAKATFKIQEDLGRQFIEAGNWSAAFLVFDRMLNGDATPEGSLFYNLTTFSYYFNYLHSRQPKEGDEAAFVNQPKIRDAIHVGNATFHGGEDVETQLQDDVMKSVRPWLEVLLEHYRVLIYNGQLDIIVAYPLTVSYLQVMNWSSADAYKTARRSPWFVDDELAGFVKKAGNLTEVLVRNAGHMVPADQPRWALDLISRFFANKPFADKPVVTKRRPPLLRPHSF